LIVIIVVGENEVDDINNVNILGFRCIVFDFIISKFFESLIIKWNGRVKIFGFYEEVGMKIVKHSKLSG
jgi:hypothetical protein